MGRPVTVIHPAGWAEPGVPLSHGARVGELLFVSGQVATRPDGSVFVGDFADEVALTFDNVEAVLTAAGCTWRDVVKINAFLSEAGLFAAFNAAYRARVPTPFPARTTVVVAFGHPDVRVEVDVIASITSAASAASGASGASVGTPVAGPPPPD